MKQNTQLIWISYDLGPNGDYESLYYWLDQNNARECGDSIAALKYEYEDNLLEELKDDLKENVELKERDRIYLVYKHENDKYIGKFIFGRRKPAPWEGYAEKFEEETEDEW